MKLVDACDSLVACNSQDSLHSILERYTQALGCRTFNALVAVDHANGSSFYGCNNVETAVADANWYSDPEAAKLDPVMQHCRRSHTPLVWSQETYVAAGLWRLWEEQAGYGLRAGIAVASHLPDGKHFLLGVDTDKSLPRAPDALMRMVADVHLVATFSQEVAMRLLVPSTPAPGNDAGSIPNAAAQQPLPELCARELELLRWTLSGKTAWEAGRLMAISERTANHYAQTAMKKLGVASKHQAVMRAVSLGLIK